MQRKLILLVICVILAVSGCQKKVEEKYVARVNDEILTEEQFKTAFTEDEWNNIDDKKKEKFLDEWIRLTMLAQECDRKGISNEPLLKRRITSSEKKIKANALIAHELSNINISEEELLSYYNLHKNEFRKRKKEYKYQRIFVKDEKLLKEIGDQLRSGVKFKDLAIKYSQEDAAKNGGYMGFVSENDVSKDIWNTLESINQYNWKSLKFNDGFLIVRWYEKHDADIEPPFSHVRSSIEKNFKEENQKNRYDSLIKKLQENSIIEKKLSL